MPQINIIHNRFLLLAGTPEPFYASVTEIPAGEENNYSRDSTGMWIRNTRSSPSQNSGNSNNTSQNSEANQSTEQNTPLPTVGSINLKAVEKLSNLFTKSYYAHDFLTPYIKCFIVSKDYINETNSVRKNNFTQKFFDIPYNLIKGMDLEYVGGFGVVGNLTLKIEDATGSIGSFLVATFFSLSLTGDNSENPYINIEFGWAEKGLKKISKKNMNRIVTKNTYSTFLILDVKIEFSDKGKQEIVITAKQEASGSSGFSSGSKSQNSPYAILGNSPVFNMRLFQYYHYFKSKENDLETALNKFSFYKITQPEEKVKIKKIVTDFISNVNPLEKTLPENFRNGNILKILSFQNRFFNFDFPVNHKNFIPMKEKFDQSIKKSYFNSYLVFCYVLNQYIKAVRDYIKKEKNNEEDIPILILPMYSETEIDKEGLLINDFDDIAQFCVKDIDMGTSGAGSKPKNEQNNLTHEFQIQQGESWESVLERLAGLVRLKGNRDPKKRPTLYISIQKYNIQDIDIKSVKNDFYKNNTKERLIKKFKNLKEMFNKNGRSTDSGLIDNFITQIEDQKKDFIYIVITKGSPFIADEDGADKIIAQSYTVYPKIDPKNRIKDQNFNSGSKPNSLLEESFPDVLYFKPEIPFKELVVSNLRRPHRSNFNNGIFSFRKEKIFIQYKDNGDVDVHQNLLDYIIKKLQNFIKDNRQSKDIIITSAKPIKQDQTVPIVYNINFRGEFDNNFNKILIYHDSLNGYSILNNRNQIHIGQTQKLIKDLQSYMDLISNGYHYSELLNIVKKSNNVFIGDNNTSEYYSYVNSINEYNKMLIVGGARFRAELKILGEPAFAFDFSKLVHVFIKVYNLNGTFNYLLSGIYSIQKVKHEISEGGSFTTTLSLLFDSAYVN